MFKLVNRLIFDTSLGRSKSIPLADFVKNASIRWMCASSSEGYSGYQEAGFNEIRLIGRVCKEPFLFNKEARDDPTLPSSFSFTLVTNSGYQSDENSQQSSSFHVVLGSEFITPRKRNLIKLGDKLLICGSLRYRERTGYKTYSIKPDGSSREIATPKEPYIYLTNVLLLSTALRNRKTESSDSDANETVADPRVRRDIEEDEEKKMKQSAKVISKKMGVFSK